MPKWKLEPRQPRSAHATRARSARNAQELRMVHLRTPRASCPQRTLLTLDPDLLRARNEDRSGLDG